MTRQGADRILSALTAVREVVQAATSPDGLFAAVVAALGGGETGCAGVLLGAPGGGLRLVSSAGDRVDRLHALASGARDRSIVSAPLVRAGAQVGVLAVHPNGSRAFRARAAALVEQVADSVSRALDRFDREHAQAARALDRPDGRFALLSATNRAVLEAHDVREMYQMVCEAATGPGKLFGASVALHVPGAPLFARVACSGRLANIYEGLRSSADPELPEGRGIGGEVFRSGEPCFIADLRTDPRASRSREQLLAAGVTAGAVLPLRRGERTIGVCSFFFGGDSGRLDEDRIELTTQIAQNISFGAELFERKEQRETLARMFEALSATNEAIMRARGREEMCELVCEAAVKGGEFNSTLIGLAQPDSEYVRIAAAAGPTAIMARTARLSIAAERPEGRGLTGRAFRSGRFCVSNDYLAEMQEGVLLDTVRAEGTRSGAAFPLLGRGGPIGVLLFMSRRIDAFTPELIALLQRVADNVSFALENFQKSDEQRLEREQNAGLTRMFAALSETNGAIMRARTRAELFDLVCKAAGHGGPFSTTTIAVAEPGSVWLRVAAVAGPNARRAKSQKLAISPDLGEGRGVCGIAFRTRRTCISNDYIADPRTRAFHDRARANGARSCAALPLLNRGEAIGVMLLVSKTPGAFTGELAALLERLAANVSFALENFDRADERLQVERQRERLTRMYTALSATNEAIMRAGSRDEMFALVCEAAVNSGNFATVGISLAEPGSDFMRDVATAGPVAPGTIRASISEADPEGLGMSGTAYRTRQPCISNDFFADQRGAAFRESIRARGIRSLASLPLLDGDRALGVLIFQSREIGVFTPDLVELLQRLTANVVFGLKNFDRAEERRLADEQRERLARMFAALSATNEAIMRAGTRAELFDLVCEAAVHGGRFASTIIALSEEGEDFLRVVAWAGPKGEMQKSVRLAVSDAYPEGRGISGTAFRTLQPCIINDYLADARGAAFHERAVREGNRAGAALPLIKRGRAVGVLDFMSSERGVFTPELVELLSRLAHNVSFALENFDRAEQKARADERIQYLATHDGLTGLPNRAMFNQLLRGAIEAARRDCRNFAVLFIDIDRFKVINDSLGHDAGDALLVETATRLRACLGARDTVARLGGDEFVVILDEAADPQAIEAASRRMLSAIGEPLQLRGLECRATASIGIAVFPGDGEDEVTLTKNADIAMYRAKDDGKNGFRFFINQNKALSVERLVFEARLRQALERGEFSLAYQPKVDAVTSRITGLEALLRWTLPDLGPLSPMQFIPLAEETGLIVPIGRWVLKTACAQAMAWRRQGLPQLSIAVNLSPRQFSEDNLLEDVDEALTASGLPAELLQLEITESMVMHNVARAIDLLDIIRGRGVRLAIDDFGTGYSSMSLMKKFPVDTIKIDRSFVKDLPDDAEDRAIAQAIISMGKALGLTIVAEGVETAEQAAFLRANGCDEMQGYLFSRPVEPERVPELVSREAPFSPTLRPVGAARASRGGGHSRRIAARARAD
jgi:diguanylate cyclase (GGDEF)-like protein